MFNIYMDSGTSTTRAYLLKDYELVDTVKVSIGTKDSALSGSNEILFKGIEQCYRDILKNNELTDEDIDRVWISGMITNTFGIIEVEHSVLPLNAAKMAEDVFVYDDTRYLMRKLYLVRGAKTHGLDAISMSNIHEVNNVRGEEIEAIGLMGSTVKVDKGGLIMISSGSHTHLCYMEDGNFKDILSCFTGELTHAIKESTILGGELSKEDILMDEASVMEGYEHLKRFGIARALYIIHATRVFDVCDDGKRTQLLAGIIAGATIEILEKVIQDKWKNAKKIVIIGDKNYIASYKILSQKLLPGMEVEIISEIEGKNFALLGFLEILKTLGVKEN